MVFLLIPMVTFVSFGQHDDNWFELGKISFNQNDLERGLYNFSQHIEHHPQDPMGYIFRAKIYKALGRKNESDLDLKIAQRLNPLSLMIVNPSLRSRTVSKNLYGFTYSDLNAPFVKSLSNYENYEDVLTQLELYHSQDSLISSALSYLIKFDVDQAESVLNQISINENNKALVNDIYGKIYMKRGKYSQALGYFDKSIEADPSFSIAYHNRSVCHKNMGDIENAKNDLENAISLNDNVAVFYFSQAKLNESLGNNKEAKLNYEQALEIDGNYKEALTNYAQILKSLGQYSEGVKYLNQAMTSETEENIFLEANIDFIYGEYEKAIEGFEKFITIHEDNSSAHFNLGLSKILLRKPAEGCLDIEQSLLLNPSEKHQDLYDLFCQNIDQY